MSSRCTSSKVGKKIFCIFTTSYFACPAQNSPLKRTGSLNYFDVFAPPCSFFHVLKKNFAPPCSLITSCSLNRYYRVCVFKKVSIEKETKFFKIRFIPFFRDNEIMCKSSWTEKLLR